MYGNYGIIADTLFMIDDLKEANKERKEELIDEYHNVTINFPRKLKKKERKRIISTYNVLTWCDEYINSMCK